MRRLLAAFAIVTVLFGAPGCTAGRVISGQGIPANVSPEGKLAIQGRAVVAACEGVLTATDAAVTAKALTPPQAIPVAQACRQVGLLGQRLATVLRVLDAGNAGSGTVTAALTEAKGILTEMTDALTTLPATTLSTLSGPVGQFSGAITTLRLMLPL